jgi:hypothetical protein
MPELVHQYNAKQGEVFEQIPERGTVFTASCVHFIHRDNEPGPMQINLDPGKSEEAEGTLFSRQHAHD